MNGMNRRGFLKVAGLAAAGLVLPGCGGGFAGKGAVSGKRPNIVLIMADDMGYSDIGCYGGEIRTPNLDGLAANGLRFTQFYNAARCCPTRASLLSGLYPHQAGIGHMTRAWDAKGYRGDLSENCVTIAEVLKRAGYSTYMSGKWHVTRAFKPGWPKDNWPCQRGFEKFYGTIFGAGSYYDPYTLTDNNTQIVPDSDDFYYTDAISEKAVGFVSEHAGQKADKPFFMYVAYTAPHWPMQARESDIARYKGRYDNGWDALRAERHKRMIKMGLVDSSWRLTSRDKKAPAWEEAENKDWHIRRMEVYAAMVDSMDRGIGRIVGAIKEAGMLEDTLILFLADNGGCAEERGSRDEATAKQKVEPMGPDELQGKVKPDKTRDGWVVRTGIGVMPGPADTFVAYGRPWANASNTPFRLYKHWVHEGGIATPLIAHWPAGIKGRGQLRHQPGHIVDIMATCVDVAGVEYPKSYDGQEIKPMEGQSLAGALRNKKDKERPLFWEHEGNRAVRLGKWKLVAENHQPWELYDLEADRTETENVIEKYPDKARRLKVMYELWSRRCGVKSWPPMTWTE
jgi:arylsulfatase